MAFLEPGCETKDVSLLMPRGPATADIRSLGRGAEYGQAVRGGDGRTLRSRTGTSLRTVIVGLGLGPSFRLFLPCSDAQSAARHDGGAGRGVRLAMAIGSGTSDVYFVLRASPLAISTTSLSPSRTAGANTCR
jgi:hypothetical protein